MTDQPTDRHARLLATITTLDGPAAAALRAVVELHEPVALHGSSSIYCDGDEFIGIDGEPPDWPCATITAIEEALGQERHALEEKR